jgi:hypothetical protein
MSYTFLTIAKADIHSKKPSLMIQEKRHQNGTGKSGDGLEPRWELLGPK